MGDERKRKRQPQLDMTVAAIQGRYGPWAVTRGAPGQATGAAAPIPHIPTGFEALDRALGTGGLPKGSVCEIVGPATSGKTTLALKVLAEAQRGGGETGGSETRPYRVGGAQKGWREKGGSETRPYEGSGAQKGWGKTGGSETRPYRVGGAQKGWGETGGSETRPYEGSGAQKGWREKGGSETRPYEGSEVQREGNQVGYIDQALYFDADYAYRCGVDLSRLVAGTPQDLAEALAMTEALVRSGSLAALVLDTLDFLWDDASTAQLLAATLSRLRAPLVHSGMILLVLHDSPDARSPALSALAHTASVRLQVVREQWIRQYGDVRGYTARVEVLKNRQGPAGQTVQLKILFNGTVHGDGI